MTREEFIRKYLSGDAALAASGIARFGGNYAMLIALRDTARKAHDAGSNEGNLWEVITPEGEAALFGLDADRLSLSAKVPVNAPGYDTRGSTYWITGKTGKVLERAYIKPVKFATWTAKEFSYTARDASLGDMLKLVKLAVPNGAEYEVYLKRGDHTSADGVPEDASKVYEFKHDIETDASGQRPADLSAAEFVVLLTAKIYKSGFRKKNAFDDYGMPGEVYDNVLAALNAKGKYMKRSALTELGRKVAEQFEPVSFHERRQLKWR